MQGNKNRQGLIGKLAKPFSIGSLIKISGQKLIMPFYHSVSDVYLPHISNLYRPKTSAEFEKDLDFILKHYEPAGLDFIKDLDSQKPDRHCFFLSFDDGLKEVHSIIAPILKRKGIPATVFVNSAFVDNKALFFRYKASLLVDAFQKQKLSDAEKIQVANILDIPESSDVAIRGGILNLKFHQQKKIDALARILEVDFEDYLKNVQPYLSSAEIKELQNEGHTIGAHSIDHPEFRYLPLEEQIRQASVSIQFVKDNFNSKILSFSFPFTDFGVGKNFFQELEKLKICDLTFGCAGMKLDYQQGHFQRIAMEDYEGTADEAMKSEYLYFILKSFLGKNTIRRK
ncbi:MAG: polysaccharide deacetylase family protein [Bacteroidales bacterium]|nr:polysaccharide deacetylase family protein [Bacteroidales bacterium]MCF8455994.1 polysaccharide deacetylase family protein [Bacteroidales bacterium]